jgi:CRISPR-associated endonuclease Csn1
MKTILGLDIGVSSVGLSVIQENEYEKTIKEMAVRIIPEDPNFHGKFYSGNTASKNIDRTTDRGIRRGNQRFKQRRDKLHAELIANNMFPNDTLFNLTALELYGLRAKAIQEKLSLEELGRVLIHLNQRRGFLSNRKSATEEENSTDYKKRLAELENELGNETIGQHLYNELLNTKSPLQILLRERTYLRASYIEEFDRIWECQKQYYSTLLTGGIHEDDNKGTLYNTFRNNILFYQRPLKSQKGLVSNCSYEKHHKAINKSSPYFEVFRIWQRLNDLAWKLPNGENVLPTLAQKNILFEKLFFEVEQKSKFKLTVSVIKKALGFSTRENIYLNFTELDGSRTYSMIKNALQKADVKDFKKYLFFNYQNIDEKGGLLELWHILYSLPTETEIVNTLAKRFGFTIEQAITIAKEVGFNADYGSLSTKAIKKLLPHLEKGLQYNVACDEVGYDHSGYKTTIDLQNKLEAIKQNSLRNPVVEQVLNQVVNMVNLAIDKHGKFDEIRVELARELRNNAKTRKNITIQNSKNKKWNDEIRARLQSEYDFKIVNGRDIQRYKLWEETNHLCLYCNNPISKTDFLNGNGEIEHILPKSRSFSNNMNNFILSHSKCNSGQDGKNQMTAYDFMSSKSKEQFEAYVEKVNNLYNDGKGKISKQKFEMLMCKGEDIPSDFVERMKKDSQYIAKEAVKMLKKVCENTYTTTGQITDFLRDKWKLKEVLQEVTIEKYRAIGQVETKVLKDKEGGTKTYETIKDWSKRDDHRHHAIDALICALTDQKIIFKLNNLNKLYQYERNLLSNEERTSIEKIISDEIEPAKKFDLKNFADISDTWFDEPIKDLRNIAKVHLDNIFISIKKSSKVLSKTINTPKNGEQQTTWVPRGRLHEETVMGQVKRIGEKKVKLNEKFNDLENIVNAEIKNYLKEYLLAFNNNIQDAFNIKQLKKTPLTYKGKELNEIAVYELVCTKRVKITDNVTSAQLEKITDKKIQKILKDRIEEHKGKIKEAFSNLEVNPIWLNKEKGIQIKSITVYDESKVEKIRNGFVKTGSNHHALIYKNEEGKYIDKVISFWEAVEIGKLNIQQKGKPYPIINKNDDNLLGKFHFSMQINDLFVFDLKHSENPKEDNEINFLDVKNRKLMSTKLFRLQAMTKKSNNQFVVDFRHHLETQTLRKINGKGIDELPLKSIIWEQISKNSDISRLTKIRINQLGDIIKIGE